MIPVKRAVFVFVLALILINFSIKDHKQNSNRPIITILSAPLGLHCFGYKGHPAVLRSVCFGLTELGVSFNINPLRSKDIADTVIVVSNIVALLQAIGLKKRKQISKLIVGPNVMERPDQYRGLLSAREIDVCVVPSRWVRLLFEKDEPCLEGKIKIWYAGINPQEWELNRNDKVGRNVLVYCKSAPQILCGDVEKLLIKYNWIPHRITYGFYSKQEYKQILSQVAFAVFLSKSETQGIALAEAWAMNVPTLVWNPEQSYEHGDWYQDISACPYLTNQTGIAWQKLQDFQSIIESFDNTIKKFSPREWVMRNMTNFKSAELLLNIAQCG